MADDVDVEFQRLKTIVKTLESDHPDRVVVVIGRLEPGSLPDEREHAVLHRVTLKRGTGRIWVTVSDPTRFKVGRPFLWDSRALRVNVTEASRNEDWLPVEFMEAP